MFIPNDGTDSFTINDHLPGFYCNFILVFHNHLSLYLSVLYCGSEDFFPKVTIKIASFGTEKFKPLKLYHIRLV